MKKSAYLVITILLLSVFAVYGQQTKEQMKVELENLKKQKASLEAQLKKITAESDLVSKKITNLELKINGGSGSKTSGSASGILVRTIDTGGTLREKPSSTANPVITIAGNEEILVHKELTGLYFKVTYKGKSGWMNYNQLSSNAEVDKIMSASINPEHKVDKSKLPRLTKLYGSEIANKIVNGVLWVGESQAQTVESIGRPMNSTKTAKSRGTIEEWIYTRQTLTFENGELKKWEATTPK